MTVDVHPVLVRQMATPLSAISRSAQFAGLEPPRPATSAGSHRHKKAETEKARGRSQSRGRDGSRKSNGLSTGSGMTSSGSSARSRERREQNSDKQPSQKAMLSKALQKANAAVQLDNKQDFDGAMEAYREACALLGQVMSRSSGDDDKRKLEAIRNTYTNRIRELHSLAPSFRDAPNRGATSRPESNDSKASYPASPASIDSEETVFVETARITRIITDPSYISQPKKRRSLPSNQIPPRRESLRPSAMDSIAAPDKSPSKSSFAHSPIRAPLTGAPPQTEIRPPSAAGKAKLELPPSQSYIPPPLSLGRPLSPTSPRRERVSSITPTSLPPLMKTHSRSPSTETTSWLDTIDESGGSSASSVHSRLSGRGLRRKRIRAASGATEAEFDAALDAAVEAAYDDGFEPVEDERDSQEDVILNARRNIELAKERVREAEREAAVQLAKERETRRVLDPASSTHVRNDSVESEYNIEDAEEEERMLEEMTRGYIMDDFEFDIQSKSALPRQSDSSGFSRRTWGSSIGSNPTTAGTSLQTLGEAPPSLPALPAQLKPKPYKAQGPLHPPPTTALPPPPNTTSILPFHPPPSAAPPRPPSMVDYHNHGVRSRRLSGQNHRQLRVETAARPSTSNGLAPSAPPTLPPPKVPNGDSLSAPPNPAPGFPLITPNTLKNPPATAMPLGLRRANSPLPDASPAESHPGFNSLSRTLSHDTDATGNDASRSASPRLVEKKSAGSGILRKNHSSSSLKNRNISVSSPDGSEISPGTPLSTQFSSISLQRKPTTSSIPAVPTPGATSFTLNGLPTGGLYLFDSDIHSPLSPGSPNPLVVDGPVSLEPCPSEHQLRPFWLMRCFYQTIANPKGGYLSTKLFVPQDVWRVKVTKIKGLEEKISNCDLLTAALLKLDQVDTFDADAVLEEMQSLEQVLDQVQAALTKKLGNDVGVQGSHNLFKDANTVVGGPDSLQDTTDATGNRGTASSTKASYLSWRRKKNKSSGAGTVVSPASGRESTKDTLSMSTLPMTSVTAIRYPKREISTLRFTGPNATYMSAIARVCDAAQVLDQIARQVEDPGLKHSSQTQVGLELSTRHAAEFFAFYVCRFVLTDLGLMMDKFIKRGSEWVVV